LSTTTLVIIRHGETLWNREQRIQGHLDSALTPEGIAQARACATRLAAEQFDAAVASDLDRVRHTAEILVSARALPIAFDASLRERCFGIGEGMTYAEMDRRYPQMFAQAGLVDSEFALPNGETRSVFHGRVRDAITRLATEHEGKRLLVVTHGGVLGVIYRWLNNLPLASSQRVAIPNVAYNRISIQPDGWKIEVWADTSHLGVETFEDA
jgi:2,3-bisphosphoglycerate-dependent phosphoglycerate mutase